MADQPGLELRHGRQQGEQELAGGARRDLREVTERNPALANAVNHGEQDRRVAGETVYLGIDQRCPLARQAASAAASWGRSFRLPDSTSWNSATTGSPMLAEYAAIADRWAWSPRPLRPCTTVLIRRYAIRPGSAASAGAFLRAGRATGAYASSDVFVPVVAVACMIRRGVAMQAGCFGVTLTGTGEGFCSRRPGRR